MSEPEKDKAWELVQKKAFTHWCNTVLERRNIKIENLEDQFADGITVISFVELLLEKKLKKKYTANPKQRILIIQNTHLALEFLKENGVEPKYLTASSEDFCDKNVKLLLGFLWMLFRKFGIAAQMGVDDVDKTTEGLLNWCKEITEGYRGVNIKDFKHSFSDGNAFLAMVHAFDTDSFNYDSTIDGNSTLEIIEKAFDYGEKNLGIPQLLDAKELMDGTVDERSVVLYVSLYFHAYVSAQEKRAIENEKRAVSAKASDLENELEILNKKVQNKEEEYSDLKMKYEELEKNVNALNAEKEKLENDSEELRNQFKKLGEQIEENAQAQLKSFSSLREELTVHVNSMHTWKDFLEQQREYESETIQLRTEQEISNREFEDQLDFLSGALGSEHSKLQILLKQREFEEEEAKKRKASKRSDTSDSEDDSSEEKEEVKESRKKSTKKEEKQEVKDDSSEESTPLSSEENEAKKETVESNEEKPISPSIEKKKSSKKKEVVESSEDKPTSPSTEKKKSSKKKKK